MRKYNESLLCFLSHTVRTVLLVFIFDSLLLLQLQTLGHLSPSTRRDSLIAESGLLLCYVDPKYLKLISVEA